VSDFILIFSIATCFGYEYQVFVAHQPNPTDQENMLISCWYSKDAGYKVAIMPNPWYKGNELENAGATVKYFKN